jgi:hypothetical protein
LLGFFELRFVGTTDFLPWRFYDSELVAVLSIDMDLATI